MATDAQAKRRELELKIIEQARHVGAGPAAQQRLRDLLDELDALPPIVAAANTLAGTETRRPNPAHGEGVRDV